MASSHTTTLALADMEATRKGWRLLPYFVGKVYTGEPRRDWIESKSGYVVELAHAVCRLLGRPGVFDRVGWRPVVITADIVGQTIAQFVTVDAKTPQYAKMSAAQKNYARAVREAGGFVGIAMRVEEAPGRVAIAEISEDL